MYTDKNNNIYTDVFLDEIIKKHNLNMFSKEFVAELLFNSLDNCTDLINCINCINCNNSVHCINSEQLKDCVNCVNCYGLENKKDCIYIGLKPMSILKGD